MSFFDFLKKPKKDNLHSSKNCLSSDEMNKNYLEMRDAEIRRLNKTYDFNSIDGVRSIPVPCKEVNPKDSPTGRVEYYLRSLCFSNHWNNGRKEVAIECLKKSQELMYVSDMIWSYDDFMKLVSYLHEFGLHDEARIEESKIETHFSKIGMYPKLTPKDFDSYKSYCAWKENIASVEAERLRKKQLRSEYYFLQEHFPDLCPKSISGYSRSKNSNSNAYQKILEKTNNFSGLQ